MYWTFKLTLSSIGFEWKKVLNFLVSEFLLHCDLSVRLFSIKRYGVWLPTSVNSISIQCMVDKIRHTVLTTWKFLRKDPWMSESLENDRWSSGSVAYSVSINWDGRKWITIVHFTLWSRSASETLSSIMFGDRFPPYVLTVVSQFIDILTKKTVLFRFPWLEFRFESFLELHVHFKGFMCIRMRKLHAECQMPADAHDWCHPKYWTTKQLSHFFWMIG